MSIRLEVSAEVDAPVTTVWDVLVDWAGQSRWIPLTTVRVTTDRQVGLGVRAEALSGVWLGRIPFGLLDRFIVTGWSAAASDTAELEIMHLGPYFTGEGVFRLTGTTGGPRWHAPRSSPFPAAGWLSGSSGSYCRPCALVLRAAYER